MSTAFRNFILTFVLSIIHFSVVGYVFMRDIYPNIKKREVKAEKIEVTDWTTPPDNGVTVPEKNERFTFTEAFFCLDNNGALCASVIIHVDDYYKTVTKIAIPTDKRVEAAGLEQTVAEFYKKSSSSERIGGSMLELYKCLTGYDIDKYFLISYSSLGDILDYISTTSIGTLKYTPSAELKYKDPLYETVSKINPDAEKYVAEPAFKDVELSKKFLMNFGTNGKKDIAYPQVPPESEPEVKKMIDHCYSELFRIIISSGELKITSTVTSSLLTCIGTKGTNLSGSELGTYGKYIFSMTDRDYNVQEFDYSAYLKGVGMRQLDWENAVKALEKRVSGE